MYPGVDPEDASLSDSAAEVEGVRFARCSKCRSLIPLPASACTRCGKHLLVEHSAPTPSPDIEPEIQTSQGTALSRWAPLVVLVVLGLIGGSVWALTSMGTEPETARDDPAPGSQATQPQLEPSPGAVAAPGEDAAVAPAGRLLKPTGLSPSSDVFVDPSVPILLTWHEAVAPDGGVATMRVWMNGSAWGCDWLEGRTQCAITGLTPGADYEWVVEARSPGHATRSLPSTLRVGLGPIRVHIDGLNAVPLVDVPRIESAVREGILAWEGWRGASVEFVNESRASVIVELAYSGEVHTNAVGDGRIVVPAGDFACDRTYTMFSTKTIRHIVQHEIGHELGFDEGTDEIAGGAPMPPVARASYLDYCQVAASVSGEMERNRSLAVVFLGQTDIQVNLTYLAGEGFLACVTIPDIAIESCEIIQDPNRTLVREYSGVTGQVQLTARSVTGEDDAWFRLVIGKRS